MNEVTVDNKQIINKLGKELDISEFLSELLHLRNITNAEDAKKFLYPKLTDLASPFLFKDMKIVSERIKLAIEQKERIVIYGDYDCDGIGAIALLTLCFREIGVYVDSYIPTRSEEGYGLNISAIDKIIKNYMPQLIITVDCGISSIEEIDYIISKNIDVIVTDHHQCGSKLPECMIVNPCLEPKITPYCGAGVAFMLARAVFGDIIAFKYLDICAVSTIADIVPLSGDNRILAKYGIERIRKGLCRKGIKGLLNVAGVLPKNLATYDVSFKIAPRLNSSGRLNTAFNSLKLLISDDETEISLLSLQLNMQNEERQRLNTQIYNNAILQLNNFDFGTNKVIVLYNKDWQEGVIGIVCAKIAEYFNRPTILLTDDRNGNLKGSARSIAGVNIYDLLHGCEDILLSYGGHQMAAGLSLNKVDFNVFFKKINILANDKYKDEIFCKTHSFDLMYDIKKFDNNVIKDLELLEPFGYGNSKPIFCDTNSKYSFSRINNTSHIKANSKNGDILGFGFYNKLSLLNSDIERYLYYTVDKNCFKDKERTQFIIKNVEIKNFDIEKNILAYRYRLTFTEMFSNNEKISEKASLRPTLYVAYSLSTFKEFLLKHKLPYLIFGLDNFSAEDTIILSPDNDFPFKYYGKIVFLDKVCKSFFNYVSSLCVNTVNADNYFLNDCHTTVESLRSDFKFFYSHINNGLKFVDFDNLYLFFLNFGYKQDFLSFFVSVKIFIELKLLKIDNGVILINNIRVNIEESELYRQLLLQK